MSHKKDTKAIAKRSAKAAERKKQKRKQQLSKVKQPPVSRYSEYSRSAMPEIEAPPGFRAIPASQAIMAYAKDIMNWDDFSGIEELNQMMSLVGLIWNYSINVASADKIPGQKERVVAIIGKFYQVDISKAQEILHKFVDRKKELFPEEVQIPGSRFMIMRTEITHLIVPFNYNQLDISESIPPIDDDDYDFLTRLTKLETAFLDGKEYMEWEDDYLDMEKYCRKSYCNWLIKKGLQEELAQDFSFYIQVFLDFVYRYSHDDLFVLATIEPLYFEEFLFDHVFRKVMLTPQEHVSWPPTLKLFYQFLSEKEYLDNPYQHITAVGDLEEQFLDILREQFS